jgi:hypothetical protein
VVHDDGVPQLATLRDFQALADATQKAVTTLATSVAKLASIIEALERRVAALERASEP